MPKVDVRVKGEGEGETESYEVYPAGTYFCEVKKADYIKSQFKDERTGEDKYQIEITWEVFKLTDEQAEAGLTTGKWFKQWVEPFYGPTKNGVSKFKALIDTMRGEGHLPEFDPNDFDTDDLVGIRQRVMVIEGTKKDGTPVNKVSSTASLKLQRRAQPAQAAAPAARPAPQPRRNAPQAISPLPVSADGEIMDGEGDLF